MIIYIGSFTFVLLLAFALEIFLWERYINRVNPHPLDVSDTKAVLAWQNRYSDIYTNFIKRSFLPVLAGAIVLACLFTLIVFLTK